MCSQSSNPSHHPAPVLPESSLNHNASRLSPVNSLPHSDDNEYDRDLDEKWKLHPAFLLDWKYNLSTLNSTNYHAFKSFFLMLALLAIISLDAQVAADETAQPVRALSLMRIAPESAFTSTALDINDSGVVVGEFVPFPGSAGSAFLFDGTSFIDLGAQMAGISSTRATAINNVGEVVGWFDTTDNPSPQSFHYDGTTFTTLPSLGYLARAWDINDNGVVVGHTQYEFSESGPEFLSEGYRVTNGIAEGLGYLNSRWLESDAISINNNGIIVGYGFVDITIGNERKLRRHASIFQNGAMTDLHPLLLPLNPALDLGQSNATGINDRGQIIGEMSYSFGQESGGFLLDGGVATGLGFCPKAINNAGTIVGSGGQTPVVRSGGVTYDLDKLAVSFLSDGASEGFLSLLPFELAINNTDQIVGYGVYRDSAGIESYQAFVLSLDIDHPGGDLQVFNANRHGNAHSFVPGATVRLKVGSEIMATVVADNTGHVTFPDPAPDLTELYDIELEKDGLVRNYQAVRPSELSTGTPQLVLPVDLRKLLEAQLTKLETTGTLILAYETANARALLEAWNDPFPRDAEVHADRDHALARLLVASEALATLYTSGEALSKDGAKLVVGTITSALAARSALDELNVELARQIANLVAQGTTTNRVATFAQQAILTAAKAITDLVKPTFISLAKVSLPPLAVSLLDESVSVITTGILSAFSSGEWDAKAGVEGARKKLLDDLVKKIMEEVGGRILASAYVAETQSSFSLAIARAQGLRGEGTVPQAFIASQDVVIAATTRNDIALDLSATIGDTTEKFGIVADVSQFVGRIPAAQIATMLAQAIKGINVALTAGAAGNDLKSLLQTATDDAPEAAQKAFFPNPTAPFTGSGVTGGGGGQPVARTLPPGYGPTLSSLRDAVEIGNQSDALDHAEILLASESALVSGMQSDLLRARMLARAAGSDTSGVGGAYQAAVGAATTLDLTRSELLIALGGYFLPAIADPDATAGDILGLIDATATSIETFETAMDGIETAAVGISTPALVLISSHGLENETLSGSVPPGPVVLVTVLVNAGTTAAADVVVTLTPKINDSPLPSLVISSASTQNIASLDPWEIRTVAWNGVAADNSPAGIGSAAAYQISVSSGGVLQDTASGGFEICTEGGTFTEWITGFPGVGMLNGFGDDSDDDRLSAGLERFLGRAPDSPDASPLEIIRDSEGSTILRHSRAAAPGADAKPSYEWSLNLADWHQSGEESGGVSILLDPVVTAGTALGPKVIEVGTEISGDPAAAFFRLSIEEVVTPQSSIPDPPQITLQPAGVFVPENSPVVFSVSATGTGPLVYQWYKDDALIPGANGSEYAIPEAQFESAGTYRVRITGAGGSIRSENASLEIDSGGGE